MLRLERFEKELKTLEMEHLREIKRRLIEGTWATIYTLEEIRTIRGLLD